MVEDFEGYSEQEVAALVSLGLIDDDVVNKKVEPVKIDTKEERIADAATPHITVKKERGNFLDVDLEEAQFFGPKDVCMELYIKFIYGECHNPKNEGMIVRGDYKTISFLNKYDDKIGLFGNHLFKVTDSVVKDKADLIEKEILEE